jgi:glutamate/tyrosine decarboxylase-like PLP-dependent enzyme
MTVHGRDYEAAFDAAAKHAKDWLTTVGERPVPARTGIDEILGTLAGPLPGDGTEPAAVVDELAAAVEPGLMAIGSGRFFGWVMGGTLPASLGADVLVSAWDQNAGMRTPTPGISAVEETAARWLLDVLHLPEGSDVGFPTGGTTANFVGLAAGRQAVLARAGWNVNDLGLVAAPPVHVIAGAERHDSVDLALRYLGLGLPRAVAVDSEGRVLPDALAAALDDLPAGEPVIVVLQAGNLHSGAFDPFGPAISAAHARGAWVHVDGAFGLWAAASPKLAHLTEGMAEADSWATDAHKTLNVTYDCGIAIVRDPRTVRAALGAHTAAYLFDAPGAANPYEKVPEMSRRARGVTVWAALRQLGRTGVADLVGGLAENAQAIAAGLEGIDGVEVLNDVVYTQVAFAVGNDERTQAVGAAILAEGDTWISGSCWHDRSVLRVSVSNWSTDAGDVARTVAAVRRAVAATA